MLFEAWIVEFPEGGAVVSYPAGYSTPHLEAAKTYLREWEQAEAERPIDCHVIMRVREGMAALPCGVHEKA